MLLKAYRQLPEGPHRQVETISGIGAKTAAILVAKIISIARFESEKKLVGYFGVFPEEESSGVDREGKPLPSNKKSMSKKGNDLVRGYLWMAALSAIKNNPAIAALYGRLKANNVHSYVALGHCMRKLLHLVFAVWTTNKPFNKEHYPWPRPTAEKTTSAKSPSDHEKTVGHKRDILPESSVVTTATPKVERELPPVNQDQKSQGSIDYVHLRGQVTIERVLRHLGHFDTLRGREQRRGPCPIHARPDTQSRDFSVNLQKNIFNCYYQQCRAHGNVLDLWAAVHKLPLYEAALHLATTFGLTIQPEQRRGTRK